MTLSPDEIVYFSIGPLKVSATLVFTWVVMALLVGMSLVVRRGLRVEPPIGRAQLMCEALIGFVLDQIRDVAHQEPRRYLPFIGTLFLFILTSNVLSVVPGFRPPTGSLTTTAALALAVFLAVPVFGVSQVGLRRYLRSYLEPMPIMLPFTILGEITRTLALAVRLFGNVMSSSLLIAVLLVVAPLVFPVLMQALGLLIGVLQAYIFTVLALVYIAAGMSQSQKRVSTGGST
ncbi:MAG: F0F1 ATP synthase subunit A [Steroidobacteraceae bacterium]|jgi:F-type H+-transporting ATPase subunit a|nr:F0F1 ATP synthase subunit A [Steroidobacteraceae bacterium]